MLIEIKLTAEHNDPILGNILAVLHDAQPQVASNSGTTSPCADKAYPSTGDGSGVETGADVVEQVTEAPVAAEKKPRKKKEEVTVEAATKVIIPEEAVASFVEEAANESAPAYTLDDVRTALQNYIQTHSIEEGMAIMREFKAGRISELAEENYAAFIAKVS